MRRLVLKRNNTNILLYGILFAVIFGIVAYPISSYLLDIGLRPLHSYLVGILVGHLTAWIVLNLTVKIEPTNPNLKGSLKKIGKALKSVVLSMAHMDYQMEFKKRKKTKRRNKNENV